MKRFLSFLVIPTSLLLGLGFTSCQQEKGKEQAQRRAPRPMAQAEKKAPVHGDILALEEKIQQGKDSYDAVRAHLFGLPRDLSESDASALLAILLSSPPSSWDELAWAAIVNDGFNVLREGKNPPQDFMERLMALHADTSCPLVLRDYALQHFGTQLAAYYRAPEAQSSFFYGKEALRQEAVEMLARAFSLHAGMVTGTAFNVADSLLSSCQASGQKSPVSAQDLLQACYEVILTPKGNEHAQISALGMLGRHRSPLAQKEARLWVQEKTRSVLSRAAALSYLSKLAQKEDRALFESLALDADLRLALPAKEGLKHLDF